MASGPTEGSQWDGFEQMLIDQGYSPEEAAAARQQAWVMYGYSE